MNAKSKDALIAAGRATMSPSYNPQPLVLDRGEGVRVYDMDGSAYLDFLSGIAVNTLGHSHPALVAALQEQAARLVHVSNAYWTEPQILLQEALTTRSFADRVFFCNSGAEANEAAIKLARRYQRKVLGTPRFEIITFEKSFHGRTYAAISATAQPKYHDGFEPMVPGFVYAPFGDLEALEARIGAHTAAIMVEPVQGEGGVRPAPEGFLEGVRALCDAHGLVLIFDEVQCGVGRTGHWFGYQDAGVVPDIMSLAKGVGGGVPLGAMVATEEVFQGFVRGSHATTYGGNPFATRAGLVVLETIEREGLLENARARGEQLRALASEWVDRFAEVEDVRGRGLMNGVALSCDAAKAGEVVAAARERGLLLNTAGGTVLRLVPPLVVTESDVAEACEKLGGALASVFGG